MVRSDKKIVNSTLRILSVVALFYATVLSYSGWWPGASYRLGVLSEIMQVSPGSDSLYLPHVFGYQQKQGDAYASGGAPAPINVTYGMSPPPEIGVQSVITYTFSLPEDSPFLVKDGQDAVTIDVFVDVPIIMSVGEASPHYNSLQEHETQYVVLWQGIEVALGEPKEVRLSVEGEETHYGYQRIVMSYRETVFWSGDRYSLYISVGEGAPGNVVKSIHDIP